MIPSIIASNITAIAKYGLQDGSGERNSTLVALPLFAESEGELIDIEILDHLTVEEVNFLIQTVETIFDTEGFTVTLKSLNKLKG